MNYLIIYRIIIIIFIVMKRGSNSGKLGIYGFVQAIFKILATENGE